MFFVHIAHVQGIFSPEHGGPTHSLANYCTGQVRAGHRVGVWALEGFPHTTAAVRLAAPVQSHIFPVEFPSALGCSRAMHAALQNSPPADLFHLHGAWLRAMYYGAEAARVHRRPYLVEVMGMYEPYSLRQKWLRKRVARGWFQDAILREASCLHVNSSQEAHNLRRLGFSNPVAVLPVGVQMPLVRRPGETAGDSTLLPALRGRPFILFLSRIHSKKGIELLLSAWVSVHRAHPDMVLVVAGTGDPAYLAKCRRQAEDLGIAESCLWPGQVSDEQKNWLLSFARLLALPTFSENYGNVVAEALAHGTPVITTNTTPWLELVSRGCGWIVPPQAAELTTALGAALAMSQEELRGMGDRGRAWAEESFSIESVVNSLGQVYGWVTGNGPKPECIA